MAGPGDDRAAAAGRDHLRASHADREHVINVLKGAFVQGCLTKDELDARVGRTFDARTYADLAAVTADIPAGLVVAEPLREAARARQPMNKAAKLGICAGIAAVPPVAIFLTGDLLHFFQVLIFYFMALVVAGAQVLDSRHQKRSRGQLPPRPTQREQALEGEQGGTHNGDLIFCEARSDARARRVPRRALPGWC